MKKLKPHSACTRSGQFPASAPEHDLTMNHELIDADLSRRGFLYSLGALALTGCGGTFASQLGATGSSVSSAFAHPGLMHTQADFVRMA